MNHLRASALLAGMLVLAATATSARADTKKHQEKFCTALITLKVDIDKLDTLGKDSSIKELRMTSDQLQKDSKAVIKEAGKIGTPTAQQFTESVRRLKAEAQGIGEDMTVEQARARLDADLKSVKQNAGALAAEAGCSDYMPTMTPKGEAEPGGANP
jgi:hypothetical protein